MTQQRPGDSPEHPFSSLLGRDIPAELVITRAVRARFAALEEDVSIGISHRLALAIGFCTDAIEDLEKRLVELGRQLGNDQSGSG